MKRRRKRTRTQVEALRCFKLERVCWDWWVVRLWNLRATVRFEP